MGRKKTLRLDFTTYLYTPSDLGRYWNDIEKYGNGWVEWAPHILRMKEKNKVLDTFKREWRNLPSEIKDKVKISQMLPYYAYTSEPELLPKMVENAFNFFGKSKVKSFVFFFDRSSEPWSPRELERVYNKFLKSVKPLIGRKPFLPINSDLTGGSFESLMKTNIPFALDMGNLALELFNNDYPIGTNEDVNRRYLASFTLDYLKHMDEDVKAKKVFVRLSPKNKKGAKDVNNALVATYTQFEALMDSIVGILEEGGFKNIKEIMVFYIGDPEYEKPGARINSVKFLSREAKRILKGYNVEIGAPKKKTSRRRK